MNRNLLLTIGGIVLAILIVMYFATSGGRQKLTQSQTYQATGADPCAEAVLIAQQQAEISRLNERLADLQARYEACLESQIPKKATTTARTTTAPRTATTPRVVTPPPPPPASTTQSAPTPPSTAVRPAGTVGKANLDGLRQNGIIPFCVMVNNNGGWHFPQLAMDLGASFPRIAKNPTGDGTNWVVEQSEWMEGDYGVTDDGIFFVSDALLSSITKAQVTQVTMKAPLIREMKKEGNYWTFKVI